MQPFGHNVHEPKIVEGGLRPLFGDFGPHLTQSHMGRGLPTYQVAS